MNFRGLVDLHKSTKDFPEAMILTQKDLLRKPGYQDLEKKR